MTGIQLKIPNIWKLVVLNNEENTDPSIWGATFRASSTTYYVALSKSRTFAETQSPFPIFRIAIFTFWAIVRIK